MAFKRLWIGRSDRYSEERQSNLNAMGPAGGGDKNLDEINPIESQVRSHAEMAYLGG